MTDKRLEDLLRESGEIAPRAELKNEILKKAKEEMTAVQGIRPKNTSRRITLRKIIAPIAACFVLLIACVAVLAGLSGENYQTVYIDVNPSVSLEFNRFGKVSGVNYLNADAETALGGLKLKGKKAELALEKIIGALDESGYFADEAELSISAVEKNKDTDKLLDKLSKHAEKIKGTKKYTVNVSKLTADEREDAKEYGISPGKYKVIAEIVKAHPEYTVDDLKDKSMAELKELLPKTNNDKDKNNKTDKDNKKEK